MRPRGFHRCAVPLHREHEAAAWVAVRAHGCVDPGSVKYEGGALVYQIDLSCIPNGEYLLVEECIKRDVEKAIRP
jgi:hypothetical protein